MAIEAPFLNILNQCKLISYHMHKSDTPQGICVRARKEECAFAVTQQANHIGFVPHSEAVDMLKVLL